MSEEPMNDPASRLPPAAQAAHERQIRANQAFLERHPEALEQLKGGPHETSERLGADLLWHLKYLCDPVGAFEHPERREIVKTRLETVRAFDGVPEALHAELARVVTELWAVGNDWTNAETIRPIQAAWARDGEDYLCILRENAELARSAIVRVLDACGSVGVGLAVPVEQALHRAYEVLGVDELEDASALLTQLRELTRTERAMLILYDFFIESRARGKVHWRTGKAKRMSEAEAEVRVAEIGEACFGWKYPYYKSVEERSSDRVGCEAVRKAVAYRSRHGQHSRQTPNA
jgi:hypothetical protein